MASSRGIKTDVSKLKADDLGAVALEHKYILSRSLGSKVRCKDPNQHHIQSHWLKVVDVDVTEDGLPQYAGEGQELRG